MKGYDISYKPYDSHSRTYFHYNLFGRLAYRYYKKKKYAYYEPGMLHDKLFSKIMNSKIFVVDLENINIDLLNTFADLEIKEVERDESKLSIMTGEEHWEQIAKEKGLSIHGRRKSKYAR